MKSLIDSQIGYLGASRHLSGNVCRFRRSTQHLSNRLVHNTFLNESISWVVLDWA